MSQQPMSLRRAFELIRRNKAVVGGAIGLGLVIGAAFGSVNPPQLTASALVVLPNTKVPSNTMTVLATSDPVLSTARPNISPAPSGILTLRQEVTAVSTSANIISVNAQAKNTAAAESAANAVANSFVGYLASSQSPIGQVNAHILQPASTASGPNPLVHRLVYALLGAIAGLILGLIAAIARGRGDRRLRSRDDIANAIGVPVLASLPVSHPGNAQDWAKLLDSYQPGAVHAWRLRKTLQHLNVSGVNVTGDREGPAPVVAVVTLTGDPRALALGPQLAAFSASLGIPTALAIGPSGDPNLTVALRTACAGWKGSRTSLQTTVLDPDSPALPHDVALTVLVIAVDPASPRSLLGDLPVTGTVIGVSAGGATAEQLAAAAIKAASGGREVAGLLVADPDQADRTTGRIPQLPRPAPRMPTRLTGIRTEVTR
jgi:capsular polysaccharide biosynthesis protein